MNRDEYEQQRVSGGYGVPKQVEFAPNSRSEMHTHDQISFVYVDTGVFILNTEDGATTYTPGQTCVLDREIPHAEEAGPEGATILVSRK